MRNHLCGLMPHVPILSRILDFVGISRFTLQVLLFAGAIGYPQGFASSEMTLISAGSFQMGSDNGRPNEAPVHQVSLEAFYIDKHETTNADYRAFVLANPQWRKSAVKTRDYLRHWIGNDFPASMDWYPVTYVTHEAAQAYCKWRGKRLPTEAEWEKAARSGEAGKIYPWGSQVDPNAANYDSEGAYAVADRKICSDTCDLLTTSRPMVTTLYNMGGNVAEWCADRYLPHYRRDNVNRRTLPAKGPFVVRGGSWFDSIFDLRCAARAYALSGAYYHIGFRSAKSKN